MDDDEDEDAPTTDEEESAAKTNTTMKIPDRLLYLIVSAQQWRILVLNRGCRSASREFFAPSVMRWTTCGK